MDAVITARPVYAYPLISWTSVLAGAAVALSLGVLLTVLGVAIGATSLNPFQLDREAKALSIGGGLWTVFTSLVALQVGGFVAARSARFADHMNGMLQGLTVWAATIIAVLILAGPSLAAGFAGATSVAIDQAVISAPTAAPGSPLDRSAQDTPAEQARIADAARKTTAILGWWLFAAMALGAVGAVAGGRIGAEHPTWPDRPREIAVAR